MPSMSSHKYNLLLSSLRTYQRKCHFDTISCTMIMEDMNQADELDDCINISSADEIDVNDDEELRDSLPTVIRKGYNLINRIWSNFGYAKLSRCSMSLDDSGTDIQVLRLSLGNDAGWV